MKTRLYLEEVSRGHTSLKFPMPSGSNAIVSGEKTILVLDHFTWRVRGGFRII